MLSRKKGVIVLECRRSTAAATRGNASTTSCAHCVTPRPATVTVASKLRPTMPCNKYASSCANVYRRISQVTFAHTADGTDIKRQPPNWKAHTYIGSRIDRLVRTRFECSLHTL